MKINKNTKLSEILKAKGGQDTLEKFNIPCLSCPMAQAEISFLKIGEICKNYGIDFEKLKKELSKLN